MFNLGPQQIENILSATVMCHDTESGCTLAKTYGLELVLPLRPRLPVGGQVRLCLRSSDIALSRHCLTGISMQNQIKGRVCALIATDEGILVQIDCGATLLATITRRACRDMGLQEGDTVYCLAKTQAFSYLAEADGKTPGKLNDANGTLWVEEASRASTIMSQAVQ